MERLKLEVRVAVKSITGHEEDGVDIPNDGWQFSRQFNLPPQFIVPQSIAVIQSGDIVVTSTTKGVVVLSKTGQVKGYFTNCRKETYDIAVTPDDRFIVPGKSKLLCYANNGKQLSTINIADELTHTLTVDRCGRIIAYTPENHNAPWSIHYADGTEISSFRSINNIPAYLETTHAGDIVFSQLDIEQSECTDVKLMDYNGGNVRVLNPPPQVTEWDPRDVCCSKQHSEIYVTNNGPPTAVYKYTAQGAYVSCVTTDVRDSSIIALSPDEKELFVVEQRHNVVKIFQWK